MTTPGRNVLAYAVLGQRWGWECSRKMRIGLQSSCTTDTYCKHSYHLIRKNVLTLRMRIFPVP